MKNRKFTRLKEYDYSTTGWYFFTINTQNKVDYFGEIINGEMEFNVLGKIAEKIWNEIPKHYPEVELDYFQIMPNHIHGIIAIKNVWFGHIQTLRQHTLSNIIGSFKSAVTKSVHESNYNNFKWQRSFYDRIIRNENELDNIRKYIEQNPLKWELEENNT